jgi:hypothetical protein
LRPNHLRISDLDKEQASSRLDVIKT